ncbi:hypothetical protein CLV63_11939 [Murinocardiopsis flavida]|uniref:Uncharacterized protein n=1 Tax=Murinocardiopsis flavida TaxID=645275 RepID=A0A2P8D3G1_9ACTN|nr:hypothetical protein CLV63_11939 [Murinocardiopsis flavida]
MTFTPDEIEYLDTQPIGRLARGAGTGAFGPTAWDVA